MESTRPRDTKAERVLEKIRALEAEVEITQRNKSTEGHLGYLRQKLAKLRAVLRKLEEEQEGDAPVEVVVDQTPVRLKRRQAQKGTVPAPSLSGLSPALRARLLAIGKGSAATREKSMSLLAAELAAEQDAAALAAFAGVWCALLYPAIFDVSKDIRYECMRVTSIALQHASEQQLRAYIPVVFHFRFDEAKAVNELAAQLLKGHNISCYREDVCAYLLNAFSLFDVSGSKADTAVLSQRGAAVQHLLRVSSSYDEFKEHCDKVVAQTMFAVLPFIKGYKVEEPRTDVVELIQQVKKVVKRMFINPQKDSKHDAAILASSSIVVYTNYCEKTDIAKEQNFIQNINANTALRYYALDGQVINSLCKLYSMCDECCLANAKRIYKEYTETPQSVSISQQTLAELTQYISKHSKSPEDVIEPLFESIEQAQCLHVTSDIVNLSIQNKELVVKLLEKHKTVALAFTLLLATKNEKAEDISYFITAIQRIYSGTEVQVDSKAIASVLDGMSLYSLDENSVSCCYDILLCKADCYSLKAFLSILSPHQLSSLYIRQVDTLTTQDSVPYAFLYLRMFKLEETNDNFKKIDVTNYIGQLSRSFLEEKNERLLSSDFSIIQQLGNLPRTAFVAFSVSFMREVEARYKCRAAAHNYPVKQRGTSKRNENRKSKDKRNSRQRAGHEDDNNSDSILADNVFEDESAAQKASIPMSRRFPDIRQENRILYVSMCEYIVRTLGELDKKEVFLSTENSVSAVAQLQYIKILMNIKDEIDFEIPNVPITLWEDIGDLLDEYISRSSSHVKRVAQVIDKLTQGDDVEGGRALGGWTVVRDIEGCDKQRSSLWYEILRELDYPPFGTCIHEAVLQIPKCALGFVEAILVDRIRRCTPESCAFLPWGLESSEMYPVKPFIIASMIPRGPPVPDWFEEWKENEAIREICTDALSFYRLSALGNPGFYLCFLSHSSGCVEKVYDIVDGISADSEVRSLELLAACLLALLTEGDYYIHDLLKFPLRSPEKYQFSMSTPLHLRSIQALPPEAIELINGIGGSIIKDSGATVSPPSPALSVNLREGLLIALIMAISSMGVLKKEWSGTKRVVFCLCLCLFNKICFKSEEFLTASIENFSVNMLEKQLETCIELLKVERKTEISTFLYLVRELLAKGICKMQNSKKSSLSTNCSDMVPEDYLPGSFISLTPVEHYLTKSDPSFTYTPERVQLLIENILYKMSSSIAKTPQVPKKFVTNPYKCLSYDAMLASVICRRTTNMSEDELGKCLERIVEAQKRVKVKNSDKSHKALYNDPLYVAITVIASVLLRGVELGGAIACHGINVPTHSIMSVNNPELRTFCMNYLTNPENNILYKMLGCALGQQEDKLAYSDLYEYILAGMEAVERGDMSEEDTRKCLLMEISLKTAVDHGQRRLTFPLVSMALSGLVCTSFIRWVNIQQSHRPSTLCKVLPSRAKNVMMDAIVNSVITVIRDVRLVGAVATYEISKGNNSCTVKIDIEYDTGSYPSSYSITLKYQLSALPTPPTISLSGELPYKLDKVKGLLVATVSKGAVCYGCSAEAIVDILSLSGFIAGESTELDDEECVCPICFCVVNASNKKTSVHCRVCTAVMHRQCYAEYMFLNPSGTCPICRQ